MKPLLAVKADLDLVQFPVFVSPKYDGFRCLMTHAGAQTRSLKPIANHYVRGKLDEIPNMTGLDGEVLTYTGGKMDDFNTVQSKLTTRQGMPDFSFWVFDDFTHPRDQFQTRWQRYLGRVASIDNIKIKQVLQVLVHSIEELMYWENIWVNEGYEGLMIRDPGGVYKYGRSTLNEGILLKVKRFEDDEGEIIGGYERMRNENEAVTNALGYTERSSHKENMVPAGDLGGFTVKWRDVTFDLGTGFSAGQRVSFFHDIDEIIGKKVTFAFQGVGTNGRPRFPSFRGFRGDL